MTTETRPAVGRRRLSHIRLLPLLCALVALAVIALALWRSWGSPADSQPQSAVESVPLARDVAVLSVDFDPPLGSTGGSARPRALLVVVDNRGTDPQTKLFVEAQVLSRNVDRNGDENDGAAVGKVVEQISALTPGEVRVVRFERIGQLPNIDPHQQATVSVRVRPTEGAGFPDDSKSLLVDWASVLRVE
jgi:hypothetical protein